MPSLRAGSQSATTGTGSATLALTVPSGAVSGDKIIIFCSVGVGSNTWSAPGFTAASPASGSTGSCQLLTRTMDGTEGWTPGTSTITVTESASHPWCAVICAIPGGYDPAPAAGQVNAASATISVPGVTTAHTGDLALWFGFCDGVGAGAGSPGTITVPAGYTAAVTQANSAGVGSVTNVGVILATKTISGSGATGTQSGTASGSFINGGVLLAISSSTAKLADAASATSLALSASMSGGSSVVPYLAGFAGTANTTTATTVPLTHAVGAGDCIAVCAGLPPTTALTVSGVSDTKGNAYAQGSAGPGVAAWICPAATPLTTSDTITVSYSATTSQSKNIVVIGVPTIAGMLPADVASGENDDLTGSTAVSVATGTPAGSGETALFVLASQNAGGAPGTLTGTTLLKQAGNVGGTTQYLTVAWAKAGAGPFTAVATLAGAAKWAALAVLLKPPGAPAGTAGLVGSEVDVGLYAAGDSALVTQGKFAAITGRPLPVTRIYFGPGNIPASLAASGLSGYVGVRKILMSMKPSFTTLSSSDLAKIDTLLASCVAGGLVADVTMFHEPAAEGLTAAQYIAGVKFYGPTVRKYYPLIYCQSAYRTHVDPTTNARYYPGDALVDKLAYDFYESDYRFYSQRLDAMAAIADAAVPPKPFGCWELGVQIAGPPSAGSANPTQAQGAAYFAYVQGYMLTRLRAGKANADVAYFSGVNQAQGWDNTIQPGSYLIPLYQSLFDALSVAPTGAPSTELADAAVTATLSLSATMTGGSPAAPPPPPPPPLPVVPPVISTTADWQFTAGPRQPAGGVTLALTDARQKSVTFRVAADQYHEAGFTISGQSPQASAFRELISDLQVMRNGQLLFAGRIVPTTDTLDGTRHDVQVTALDYREVLRRRMMIDGDTLNFTGTDQALIAWTLIQATQARAGGDLGIARGRGQVSGVARTQQFSLGDMIGDNISTMGLLDSGYDWDITPYGTADLRLDMWSPERGMDRGVILELGGSLVASITRSVDPSGYANADYLTGQTAAGTAITAYIEDPGIATSGPGRWDRAVGTTIAVLGTLQAKASWYLADGEVVVPSYQIALTPGAWGGPDHIWMGDLVTVRIASGRLMVNDRLRVTELDIAVGDDGDERVTLAVGRIPPDLNRIAARMLRRIRDLELR